MDHDGTLETIGTEGRAVRNTCAAGDRKNRAAAPCSMSPACACSAPATCWRPRRKPWSPSPGKWVSPAPSNGGSAAAPEPIRTIMEWMIFWTSPSAPGVPPLQPAMESAALHGHSRTRRLCSGIPHAGACCRPRPRHMAAPKCHTAQPRTGQRHGGTTDPCRARSAGSHPILPPRKGGGLTADDAGFAGSLR